MSNVLKKTLTIGLMGLAFLTMSNAVFATSLLDEDTLGKYSQNSIIFYDPCENFGVEICRTNQNYAGEQVFTDEQLQAVEANSPYYQKAAEKYDIPWQLIAAIHVREHGLARSNPSNGQGVYQFASAKCPGGDFTPGIISDEQFQIQTDCAARVIKENYGSGLDLNTDNGVKKMFFRYNGTVTVYKQQALALGFSQEQAENGEGSPYVMNRYDAKREPSSTWGQIKTDGGSISYPANNDFGAFVYYKAISCEGSSGRSGGDLACGGNGNVKGTKNINATAVALAWPKGEDKDTYSYKQSNGLAGKAAYKNLSKRTGGEATDEFNTAIDEVYNDRKTWNQCSRIGASCDVFVGTVVRYSGYDKKFPRSLGKVLDHVRSNDDLWNLSKWDGDKSKVQAGDILFRSTHIAIAVRDENNDLYIAEAALCRTFGHIKKFSSNFEYIIRAKDANNSISGVSVTNGVGDSVSTGTTTKTGQGNGDIGASAFELAWKLGEDDKAVKNATERFAKYYEEVNGNAIEGGKSCDCFAGTVVRYSGLNDDFPVCGGVSSLMDYAEKSDDWEKIEVADSTKLNEYEPGDLVFYYKSSSNGPEHVGIYAEDSSGKPFDVSASLGERYGLVRDSSYITNMNYHTGKRVIYRNKNNKSGTSDCNVCEEKSSDAGGDVSLKDGGLSLEKAKALMAIYKGYAGENNLRGNTDIAKKYYIKVGCHGNLFLNCPSFVKYFVNRYTTKTWTSGLTGDGRSTYKYAANALGLETGNKPQPYAIFSDDSYSPGHTGIVLAVDSEKGKMLVGQAGCLSGGTTQQAYDYIGVEEKSINSYHLYAYLDKYIKLED